MNPNLDAAHVSLRGVVLKPAPPRSHSRGCSVEGCDRKHKGLGLCDNHYQMLRYYRRKAEAGGSA